MNKKSIIAIVLLVITILLIIFSPTVELLFWFSIVGIIMSITSLILNYLVKKENNERKSVTTLCNIFGIIVLVFCLLEFISILLMNNPDLNEQICKRSDMVSDCVDDGKGISKCKYMKQIEIPCNNDVLEDNQIK